jgi:hypothetical protein
MSEPLGWAESIEFAGDDFVEIAGQLLDAGMAEHQQGCGEGPGEPAISKMRRCLSLHKSFTSTVL